jgi:leader peptidase (prepilin peptidase)/N-methyltransferase
VPPSAILGIYAAVLGLITGSYLNVVIHRLPRGVSTVLPPSSCPSCGVRIRARDNVPVLSFLVLRGRCRGCGRSIGWRDPMVEAATGALFLACYLRFGPTWSALVAALFGSMLIALALIDLEHFILPDRITLPGIALGLVVQPLVQWAGVRWPLVKNAVAALFEPRWWPTVEAVLGAVAGALIGAGVIWGMNLVWLKLRGVHGFGFGDVKMLAMIGAFLGLSGVAVTLFLGALLGSLVGIALMARQRLELQSRLPFGFFLSIGALAALFCGRGIVDWYLSFFP